MKEANCSNQMLLQQNTWQGGPGRECLCSIHCRNATYHSLCMVCGLLLPQTGTVMGPDRNPADSYSGEEARAISVKDQSLQTALILSLLSQADSMAESTGRDSLLPLNIPKAPREIWVVTDVC